MEYFLTTIVEYFSEEESNLLLWCILGFVAEFVTESANTEFAKNCLKPRISQVKPYETIKIYQPI